MMNGKMLSLELIRAACQYEAMDALWHTTRSVYGEGHGIKRHELRDASFFEPLLRRLSTPNANKSEVVVNGAKSLLENMYEPSEVSKPSSQIPEAGEKPQEVIPEKPKEIAEVKIVNSLELEIVFFTCVIVAMYGYIYLFKEMGVAFSVPYFLICRHALKMTKNRYSQQTASNGITAVIFIEIISAPVHFAMFLKRAQSLPETLNGSPNWLPTVVAIILAAMFSVAGIYALTTLLRLTREASEATNYEKNTGQAW